MCLSAYATLHVQCKRLIEVLATESTHNHDRVSVELRSAQALARLDGRRRVVLVADDELGPHGVQVVQALLDVEALDRVDVALRDVGDTGEDIDPFVVELATCVVVAPVHHQGQIGPRVCFCVEDLCLASREIDILPRARNQNILAHERTSGVAMTRCPHIGLLEAIVSVGLLVQLQLVAFIHRLGCLLVIATADQIQVGLVANLDALVVVRQGNLETINTVVKLGAAEAIRLSVVAEQHL